MIAGIAIDHRDSLRVMLERRGSTRLGTGELRSLKLALTRALAPAATAIMLDEELGGLALDAGAVPPSLALIMPLEAQGYEDPSATPITRLMADFSPADALRRGADACKVLLPYRADDPDASASQDALVRETVAACHEVGLPLVVEPVVYRRSNETESAYAASYPGLVHAAAARLRALGPDLLKVPFPVLDMAASGEAAGLDACRHLAAACDDTPWVLLGAGVETDIFVEQIRLAGMSGAAGFLAGRGIWGAAVGSRLEEAEEVAIRICRPALERCRETAERYAQPLNVPITA